MPRIHVLRPLPLLAVGTLLWTGAARAQEPNWNQASVRPVAVIPFLAETPTIDGVTCGGKWSTLHVSRFIRQGGDLLQQRPGEVWVGCDHAAPTSG